MSKNSWNWVCFPQNPNKRRLKNYFRNLHWTESKPRPSVRRRISLRDIARVLISALVQGCVSRPVEARDKPGNGSSERTNTRVSGTATEWCQSSVFLLRSYYRSTFSFLLICWFLLICHCFHVFSCFLLFSKKIVHSTKHQIWRTKRLKNTLCQSTPPPPPSNRLESVFFGGNTTHNAEFPPTKRSETIYENYDWYFVTLSKRQS